MYNCTQRTSKTSSFNVSTLGGMSTLTKSLLNLIIAQTPLSGVRRSSLRTEYWSKSAKRVDEKALVSHVSVIRTISTSHELENVAVLTVYCTHFWH